MRAPIIQEYEMRLHNLFSWKVKGLLKVKSFSDINEIFDWLLTLFRKEILIKEKPGSFDLEIIKNKALQDLVKQGDSFYINLFRSEGFITEHTQEKEQSAPFTIALQKIYERHFQRKTSHDESLIIYHYLTEFMEMKFGEKIAADPDLQTFDAWQLIDQKLEVEHATRHAWLSNILLKSITKEKQKFCAVPENTLLHDLAILRGYGRNNEAEARNYLRNIEALKSKSSWQYISGATHSADLLTFKGDVYLHQELLHKSGLADWLKFIDSLRFPILQNHAFQFIDDLNDYAGLIQLMSTCEHLQTSREHLLLITLQNYFSFIDRTLIDLNGYTSDGNGYSEKPESDDLFKEVKAEYERWVNELIPQSFTQILGHIFPLPELSKSGYFLSFFEWMNSHSKLNVIRLKSRVVLIDLLNNLFQSRLDQHEPDRHFLSDNLTLEQLNWEAFKKLAFIHVENKSDLSFRDKLYEKYLLYIRSEQFSFNGGNGENFDLQINDAFYFSVMLGSFNDPLQKWKSLFNQSKIFHEGWLKSGLDHRRFYRESFMLTAGAGLAYYHYSEGQKETGDDVVIHVLMTLIRQHRNAGDIKSIDYVTPLKFIAICIGKYSKDSGDDFLKLLSNGFDRLKFVLIATYELSLYIDPSLISIDRKEQIKGRIDTEFWLIEKRKSEPPYKADLDYYKQLRDAVSKLCNR